MARAEVKVPDPAPADRNAFTQEVLSRLRAAGFPLVGVCDAEASGHEPLLRRWLAEGKHGEMSYLAEHIEERLDPRVLVRGARSVICVADRHHDGRRSPAQSGADALPVGRIARYARGADYHELIRSRLEPLAQEWRTRHAPHRFRVCVDTAPLLEREHAMRAGIGRIGKNTLLLADGLGSWLSLGGIVTTYPLLAHRASPAPASSDPCGSCTRCIDACPTGAITPWSVDASRCLSYLTIEHEGDVASELEMKAGEWLFGCDDCQEVCPHNQPTRRSRRAGVTPGYEPRLDRLDLLEVLGWSKADFEAAQFTAVIRRASLSMLRRSAVAILGAALLRAPERRDLRRRLETLAIDAAEDEIVRRAAQRAIDRVDRDAREKAG